MANLSNWYEAKTLEDQKLVDAVSENTRFVITEQQYDVFLAEICQIGIDNAQKFVDAFFAEYEGQEGDVFEKFMRDWMSFSKNCFSKRMLKELDPRKLWSELAQHDFHKLEVNGHTYFIKRHF